MIAPILAGVVYLLIALGVYSAIHSVAPIASDWVPGLFWPVVLVMLVGELIGATYVLLMLGKIVPPLIRRAQ